MHAARDEEGVLRDETGDAIRLDPRSRIRFHRTDGMWTEWWTASDLLVAKDGVLFDEEHGGIRWADVDSAEVENFSGGKTLVATVAITAATIGLVFALSKAKGGPKLGHLHLDIRTNGGGHSSSSDAVPRVVGPPESFASPERDGATPLFDGLTKRRSIVRFGAALDAGAPFGATSRWSSGALGVLRFTDFFEMGAGVRMLGRGSAADAVWIMRLGMHAELDAHRRFAFPLLFDFGRGSAVSSTFRITFGLRVRATDALWIGLHPLNPMYVGYEKNAAAPSGWTFPTSVEASFMF
jgi:hypothetical protein